MKREIAEDVELVVEISMPVNNQRWAYLGLVIERY